MYRLKCKTCYYSYIGQTGSSLKIRYREHIRYIKTDNPNSIYALHILNNRHAHGRKHGISRNMYKGAENELLGITFYINPSTTGYIDRRTERSMTSTLLTRWRKSQGCTETISQKMAFIPSSFYSKPSC